MGIEQNPAAVAAAKKAEAAEKKAAKAEAAKASKSESHGKGPVPRLKTMYRTTVAPALKEEFGYTSSMQDRKSVV
jgi:hypothetical protein